GYRRSAAGDFDCRPATERGRFQASASGIHERHGSASRDRKALHPFSPTAVWWQPGAGRSRTRNRPEQTLSPFEAVWRDGGEVYSGRRSRRPPAPLTLIPQPRSFTGGRFGGHPPRFLATKRHKNHKRKAF